MRSTGAGHVRRSLSGCLLLILSVPSLGLAADGLEFNRDIRPILSANCFACHGFDAKSRQAELRLDTPEGAFTTRDGTTPLVPGNLTESTVWQRIISDDPDTVMPPPDSHKELKPEQKEILRRWIEQGAPYQKHWAFEAPVAATPPTVQHEHLVKTDVDRFLLARLQAEGLSFQTEADRPTLIRRVAFATTGLPPTLEEVQQFVNDQSPRAYEEMVERYLASPRYGEEMARHWLDVARYADTHGLHLDNEREMWAYRDWVINAFNRNLSFDQFTIEQLAGDLLPNPTQDQLIATGFNRCNVTTSEGGSIAEEFLYRYAVERASTTVETWLGLTGGCAVCHDHKFDPISAKEFYSLYAFFYSAADPAMDKNIRDTEPFLALPTPQETQRLDQLKQQEQQARQQQTEFVAAQVAQPSSALSADFEGPVSALDAIAVPVRDVWWDDLVPLGASVRTKTRNALLWSDRETIASPSGHRSLKQAGAQEYYDRFEKPGIPWVMPRNGQLSVMVYLDPKATPKAIMLEFGVSKGTRRIIWGDAKLVGSGTIGSPERFRAGDLPPAGQWAELTVSAEQLNWPAGEEVQRFAFIEYDGVVWWDALSVTGELPRQEDPRASFLAWWSSRKGQDTTGIAADLQKALKAGPQAGIDSKTIAELQTHFLTHIARPQSAESAAIITAALDAEAARRTLEENLPGTFIFKDLAEPRQAFVMDRGQYDKPTDPVQPGTPAILPALKPQSSAGPANRLDLARWLLTDEQPLTARVTVNRFWQQFFGTGLVKTSEDFGSQGAPPSHPELLDWLAVWYRDHNWDTKALVRLYLHSAAFRQSTKLDSNLHERDPENRLYARGPRFRLDAEQIRDNALFVSGLINLEMGGPGSKIYQPPNIWEPVGYADSNTRFYLQDHGGKLYRRSIYCFLKRTAPPPFMSNFDGPNREQFCPRRERTNTPLQALQLLNDTQHVEAARAFAERILTEGGPDAQSRLAFAWKSVLSREPEAAELQVLQHTLDGYLNRYQSDEAAAKKLIQVGEAPVLSSRPPAELAAYTLIGNLLLNLDETVTRN